MTIWNLKIFVLFFEIFMMSNQNENLTVNPPTNASNSMVLATLDQSNPSPRAQFYKKLWNTYHSTKHVCSKLPGEDSLRSYAACVYCTHQIDCQTTDELAETPKVESPPSSPTVDAIPADIETRMRDGYGPSIQKFPHPETKIRPQAPPKILYVTLTSQDYTLASSVLPRPAPKFVDFTPGKCILNDGHAVTCVITDHRDKPVPKTVIQAIKNTYLASRRHGFTTIKFTYQPTEYFVENQYDSLIKTALKKHSIQVIFDPLPALPPSEAKISKENQELNSDYNGSFILSMDLENITKGPLATILKQYYGISKFLAKPTKTDNLVRPYKISEGRYIYLSRWDSHDKKENRVAFNIISSHMLTNSVSKLMVCSTFCDNINEFLKNLAYQGLLELSIFNGKVKPFITPRRKRTKQEHQKLVHTVPDEVLAPLNVIAGPSVPAPKTKIVSKHNIPLKHLFRFQATTGHSFFEGKNLLEILPTLDEGFAKKIGFHYQHDMLILPYHSFQITVKGLENPVTYKSGSHVYENVVYALIKNVTTFEYILTLASVATSAELLTNHKLDIYARKSAWLVLYNNIVKMLCRHKDIKLPETIPASPLLPFIAYHGDSDGFTDDLEEKLLDLENFPPTNDLANVLSKDQRTAYNAVFQNMREGIFAAGTLSSEDIDPLMDESIEPFILPREVIFFPPAKGASRFTFPRSKVNFGFKLSDLNDKTFDDFKDRILDKYNQQYADSKKALDDETAALVDLLEAFCYEFTQCDDLRYALSKVRLLVKTRYDKLAYLSIANHFMFDKGFNNFANAKKDYIKTRDSVTESLLLQIATDPTQSSKRLGDLLADKDRPALYKFLTMEKVLEKTKQHFLVPFIGSDAYKFYNFSYNPVFVAYRYINLTRAMLPQTQTWTESIINKCGYAFEMAGSAFARGAQQQITSAYDTDILTQVKETLEYVKNKVGSSATPMPVEVSVALNGITLDNVIPLIETVLSRVIINGINTIFDKFGLDPLETVSIPIGKIIACYILYQRISHIDISSALAIMYITMEGTGILPDLMHFVKSLFSALWTLIKKFTSTAIRFLCKGCEACKFWKYWQKKDSDSGLPHTESDEEPAPAFDTLSDEELASFHSPGPSTPAPSDTATPQPTSRVVPTPSISSQEAAFNTYMAGLDDTTPPSIPTPETEQTSLPPPASQGVICWFFDQVSQNSPTAIGILGTAVAIALGLTANSSPNMIQKMSQGIIGVAKNLHWVGLGLVALPKIYNYVVSAFIFCQQSFAEFLDPKQLSDASILKKTQTWLDNCGIIEHGIIQPAFFQDHKVGIFYHMMYVEGLKIKAEYMRKLPPQVQGLVEKTWTRISKLRGDMDTIQVLHTGLQEPFHVQFCGQQGIGKTNLHQTLIPKLAPLLGCKSSLAYPFNDDLKHFDGYLGQEAALNDDMFVSQEDENIGTKIRLFSGAPVIIPIARCEDKGVTPSIKLFMSNTNTAFPNIDKVNCIESVWRRRVLIKVEKAPEGVIIDNTIDNIYLKAMKFTVLDPTNPSAQPLHRSLTNLSYSQLERYLSALAVKHKNTEDQRAMEYGKLDIRRRFEAAKNELYSALANVPDSIANYCFDRLDHLYTSFAEPIPDAQSAVAATVEQVLPTTQCLSCMLPGGTYHSDRAVYLKTLLYNSAGEGNFVRSSTSWAGANDETPHFFKHSLSFGELHNVYGKYMTTLQTYNTRQRPAPCYILTDDRDLFNRDHFGGVSNAWYTRIPEHKLDFNRVFVEFEKPIEEYVFAINTVEDIDSTIMKVKNFSYDVSDLPQELVDDTNFKLSVAGFLRTLYKDIAEDRSTTNTAYLYELCDKDAAQASAAKNVAECLKRVGDNRTIVRRVFSFLLSLKSPLVSIVKRLFKWVITILAVVYILLAIGILFASNRILYETARTPSVQYNIEGRRRNTPFTQSTELPLTQSDFDSAFDGSHNGQLMYLARRSTISFKYKSKSGSYVKGQMIAVRGNILLANAHSFKEAPDQTFDISLRIPVRLGDKDGQPRFRVDEEEHFVKPSNIIMIPNYDAVAVVIPTMRPMVDTSKHFVSQKSLDQKHLLDDPINVVVVTQDGLKETLYNGLRMHQNMRTTDMRRNIYENRQMLTYEFDNEPTTSYDLTHDNFTYSSKPGESGALVVSLNRYTRTPFIGIHGATARTAGCVVPITQEMLEEVFSKVEKMNSVYIPEPVVQCAVSVPEKYGNLNVVGTTHHVCYSPPKSSYIPTPIQKTHVFPCTTAPAILADHDHRWVKALHEDPNRIHYARTSILKYEHPEPKIDFDELLEAADAKAEYMVQFFRNVKIQTLEESIAGSGLLGSKPMDRTTSPGLPYINMGSKKGKTEWIDVDPNSGRVYVEPRLLKDIDNMWDALANNSCTERYKGVFLKDETLPISKILNKTRTVSMGDVGDHAVYGMLFGDYDRILKISNVHDTHVAIGLDLESDDSHILIAGLEWLDFLYCFDAKNWDGSYPYALRKANAYYRAKVYDLAHKSRGEEPPFDFYQYFCAYVEGQCCANLVHRDIVSRTRAGMKSGERGTTVENSEGQDLMVYRGWRKMCDANGLKMYKSYECFITFVKHVFCGDDSAFSVHPDFRKFITPTVIASWYTEMGFKVTAADKSAEITSCSLPDFQFLKHHFEFSREHGRYIAIPDISIVYNLLNWQTTTLPIRQQFTVNCLAAMRFAYWHGRGVYDQIKSDLNHACLARSVPIFTVSYDAMGAWIAGSKSIKEINQEDLSLALDLIQG